MQTLHTILLVVQVLTALCLVGLILIQHGRGADAGAAFGSGASATVFGARGSSNFFSRATSALAAVFLANSLALAWIATERVHSQQSLITDVATQTAADTGRTSAPVPDQSAATEPAPAGETAPSGTTAPPSGTEPAPGQSDVPAIPAQQ